MKKTLIVLIAVCSLLIGGYGVAGAVEVKAGLATEMMWWSPAFKALYTGKYDKFGSFSSEFDNGLDFMLGPTITLGLGDWNMNAKLLFGLTEHEFEYNSIRWNSDVWQLLAGSLLALDYNVQLKKPETRRIDTSVSFDKKFAQYFKFIVGLRHNYNSIDSSNEFNLGILTFPGGLAIGSWNMAFYEYSNWLFGPTAGVGFEYGLPGNVKLIANVNGVFNYGHFNLEKRYLTLFEFLVPYKYKGGYLAIGLDNYIGASILVASKVEISAGFRYQVLWNVAMGGTYSKYDFNYDRKWINHQTDQIFAVSLGAAYKF